MATATILPGGPQREGNQMVERYAVTINRGESAAFTITTKWIRRLLSVEGPGGGVITADSTGLLRKATFSAYPFLTAFDIDSRLVAGVDDLTAQGTFTGTAPAVFTVFIFSSAASPDQFKWSKDGGTVSSAVAITAGTPQALSDGVTITFAAGDGHTLNDTWVVTAFPATSVIYVKLAGLGG